MDGIATCSTDWPLGGIPVDRTVASFLAYSQLSNAAASSPMSGPMVVPYELADPTRCLLPVTVRSVSSPQAKSLPPPRGLPYTSSSSFFSLVMKPIVGESSTQGRSAQA